MTSRQHLVDISKFYGGLGTLAVKPHAVARLVQVPTSPVHDRSVYFSIDRVMVISTKSLKLRNGTDVVTRKLIYLMSSITFPTILQCFYPCGWVSP